MKEKQKHRITLKCNVNRFFPYSFSFYTCLFTVDFNLKLICYLDHTGDHVTWLNNGNFTWKGNYLEFCFKDGATLAFCENDFCRNLKTNKVKYIKVYIFRKEISQGIYVNGQNFG